jgi:small-conductance mechanosensitive channel
MVAAMPPALHTIHFAALSATARDLITAGTIILAGLAIGLIADRLVIGGIRRLAAITQAKLDDIIIGALKRIAVWVFFLIGVFAALPFLPFYENIEDKVPMGSRLAILVLSTIVAARFASGVAAQYAHKILPSSVSLAKIIVNAIIFLIGMLVIFQTMGIEITPLVGALGVGGIAVALALQDTLANFFAGIQLLALKQIKLGDYIHLDTGQDGYVHDIGWRNTILRMVNTNRVIVPNTKLAQAIVTNFSMEEPDVTVRLAIGVAYDSDLEKVERVAIEVAREVVARLEKTTKTFEPVVRFNAFGDSSIEFSLVVRCTEFGEQFLIQHELVKAIHRRFAAEGIEIPFPMRTIVMKGSQTPA